MTRTKAHRFSVSSEYSDSSVYSGSSVYSDSSVYGDSSVYSSDYGGYVQPDPYVNNYPPRGYGQRYVDPEHLGRQYTTKDLAKSLKNSVTDKIPRRTFSINTGKVQGSFSIGDPRKDKLFGKSKSYGLDTDKYSRRKAEADGYYY